jgi:hypothetical protein
MNDDMNCGVNDDVTGALSTSTTNIGMIGTSPPEFAADGK